MPLISFSGLRRMRVGELCLVLLAAAILTACGNDSKPSSSDIESEFKLNKLPGLLQLESFSLEDGRNAGSEERPVWMARFSAEVSLREDTYSIETVERDTRILKPVRSAGETFTLYGRARSALSGENWQHSFEIDPGTEPVLGRPLASYGPDALVSGSEEARELLAAVEEKREQERIAREAQQAAEAAERQRVEEAVARHGAAIAPERIERLSLPEGTKQAFLVTADREGIQDVWGTDTYRTKSDFVGSVIHSGLLDPGETGIIEVTMSGWHKRFVGSPRNGVTSRNYVPDYWQGEQAYEMRLLEKIN